MEILFVLFVFAIVAGMLWMTFCLAKDEGYKKGQVDAINGKQEYVLCEFKDGTRDYYKKSELKDLIEYKIVNL